MLTNIKIKNIRIFITSNVVMVTDEENKINAIKVIWN